MFSWESPFRHKIFRKSPGLGNSLARTLYVVSIELNNNARYR